MHAYWEYQEDSIMHGYCKGKGMTLLWKSVWKLAKNKHINKQKK
jgi:hypothetical protein